MRVCTKSIYVADAQTSASKKTSVGEGVVLIIRMDYLHDLHEPSGTVTHVYIADMQAGVVELDGGGAACDELYAVSLLMVRSQRPLEPNPRALRAEWRRSSTTASSITGSEITTSWAMRCPASQQKARAGSLLSSRTRISPR
jgi:hypothetical protein